uniref:EamA domain-containing protein n=1 Tax=Odontella aurita TaxID=265563 RepID=A0A6U6LGZ5_9STRA|mmetsp:Transcript_8192/g.24535  ORF Transcript_8192/g.24535 Transcript_8192/m.24535 type:complete len:441 (+) Transcript_8192:298-1620(+)
MLLNLARSDLSFLEISFLSGPTAAFVSAVATRVGDDVTFKFLCDAFPTGKLFFFLSTISPVILAAVLWPITATVQRCSCSANAIRGGVVSSNLGEHDRKLSDSSKGEDDASTCNPWKPSRSHAAIAVLDQIVTLLATAGGPQTPGYAQVIINQSMVPLTALASSVVFGRSFRLPQMVAAALIVLGSIFAGLSVLADEHGIRDDSNDQINEVETTPGVAVSVALFSAAQIPNAMAHIWREHLLKDEDKNRGIQSNLCATPLRILRLATSINIARAMISLALGMLMSLLSPSIAAAMSQGFEKISTNSDNATKLVMLNTLAWIVSKLSILWVSSGRGGAFLSSIAGAVALPLEVATFRYVAAESPHFLALLGLGLSLVGLIAYFKAAPGEFVSAESCHGHSPDDELYNEDSAVSDKISFPLMELDEVEGKWRSRKEYTEDTG